MIRKCRLFGTVKYAAAVMAVLLMLSANCPAHVKAAKVNGYPCKTISVSERYSGTTDKNSYKKIVKSYKDLVKLKKYIRKNYNHSKKYIKELNKYKKSYFKKKGLIFATENIDLNHLQYKLLSIAKKDGAINLNVEKRDLLKEGQSKTTVVLYGADTYIIEADQSKLKNVRKVKVTYHFVKSSKV